MRIITVINISKDSNGSKDTVKACPQMGCIPYSIHQSLPQSYSIVNISIVIGVHIPMNFVYVNFECSRISFYLLCFFNIVVTKYC